MTLRVPTYDLTGKTAIVTGSARGIGLEIAKTFAAAGAWVVISDLRQRDCDQAAEEIKGNGCRAVGVAADVSQDGQRRNLIRETVRQFGKVDILINNAGISGKEAPILDIGESDWDEIHDIDLKSLFFLSKEFALQVKEQGTGGRIVNLASAAGIKPTKYVSVYGAAKSAVIHLTKIMANEWARYGILANAVAPGYILTDMTRDKIADEKNAAAVMRLIALRRYGQVSDVADVTLFLCTEASRYLTGVLIPVDGGMTIG